MRGDLCHAACGIFVPQPGVKPRPSAVKAQSPNHWTTREFPSFFLKKIQWASLVAQWPWPRKIPHAAEQLSPCATTTEPELQSPRATTTEPVNQTTEACAPRAHAPQQEKPQREARALQRRVAPAHCNQRKPVHSNEDTTQTNIYIYIYIYIVVFSYVFPVSILPALLAFHNMSQPSVSVTVVHAYIPCRLE